MCKLQLSGLPPAVFVDMRNFELMVEEIFESLCRQHWVKCTKLFPVPECEAISTGKRAC